MKTLIKLTAAAFGLAVFGLVASSCSDMTSSSSHQMGPPGKSRAMLDKDMPTKAN
ncbi:hypothetical protein HQ447_07675 [bacterium]|nr:hypothetical protein [bacterium]